MNTDWHQIADERAKEIIRLTILLEEKRGKPVAEVVGFSLLENHSSQPVPRIVALSSSLSVGDKLYK